MKIIDVEQGSPEWLAWRKTVITGTDCPAIRGNSPWSTAYKCWQKKLDLIPEDQTNEAMERGKRLEPEARAHFNKKYGMPMVSRVVESTEFDFLGASLDGHSFEYDCILEIKCGGSKLHSMAKRMEIPQYYQDQMQHQLLVTGASRCFYYSYDGEEGISIEVLPDPKFKEEFLPLAREFWKCVAFNEAPKMIRADFKDKSENTDLKEDLKLHREIKLQMKNLEEREELLKNKIIENYCEDESCICDEFKIIKTNPNGRVDYSKIPELKGVDLDKYRKPSSTVWKIL